MIDNLSITVHAIPIHVNIVFRGLDVAIEVCEMVYNFRDLPLNVETVPSCLKHIKSNLRSRRGQCFSLLSPDNAIGIHLWQVYLCSLLLS